MAISTSQVSVGTTATLLVADNIQAEEVHLHCTGIVYVGDSTVTSSTGLKLDNGDKITFNTHVGAMYAVAHTGTVTVYVAVIDK